MPPSAAALTGALLLLAACSVRRCDTLGAVILLAMAGAALLSPLMGHAR